MDAEASSRPRSSVSRRSSPNGREHDRRGGWNARGPGRAPVRELLRLGRVGAADAGAAPDEVWWSLAPADWLEAFAHHPRIGERQAAAAQSATARGWSADEQRGAAAAGDDVKAALAAGNREYERRFGHIYLVCATGKTAPEMLGVLRQR